MDVKRIVKNVLFIVLVPSVVVAGYYGYKYMQNRKIKKEEESDDEKSNIDGVVDVKEEKKEVELKKEVKVNVISEMKEEGFMEKETKVIPITRGSLDKLEKTKKINEA